MTLRTVAGSALGGLFAPALTVLAPSVTTMVPSGMLGMHACYHPYTVRILSHDPLVLHMPGFVNDREINAVIAQATPEMGPAHIITADGGEQLQPDARNSDTTFFFYSITGPQNKRVYSFA